MPLKTLQRSKDKPRLTRDQIRAARRVSELSWIYRHQYPHGLPHNGLGVKYAKYICRTMAFLPNDRRRQWLDQNADWMDAPTRDYILSLGPYWYAPASLGNRLELYDEDREKLEAWSIEAVGITKEQRHMINREKNRKAQERRRRKNGAKPQAQSERRARPWEAMKISESTYYRRKKRDTISSRPSLTYSKNDKVLSSAKPQSAATLRPAPSEPHASPLPGRNIPDMQQQEPQGTSEPHTPTVAGSNIIQLFPQINHSPMQCSRAREDIPLLRLAA